LLTCVGVNAGINLEDGAKSCFLYDPAKIRVLRWHFEMIDCFSTDSSTEDAAFTKFADASRIKSPVRVVSAAAGAIFRVSKRLTEKYRSLHASIW